MKRLVVFPLVLGFVGALSVCLSFFERFLPEFLFAFLGLTNLPMSFAEAIEALFEILFSDYGKHILAVTFVSTSIGVALALWDMFRNYRREISLLRLAGNLFWCGLLGLILGLVNAFLCSALSHLTLLTDWFFILSVFAIATPNTAAILWAAIRTITTDDVLTPRVLRDKLRERSRLN